MDTELTYRECVELLSSSLLGRCAFCTPQGPVIVPVNHSVVGESIIIRTAPYSQLGTLGWSAMLAYEVDGIDSRSKTGWSVVARGRGNLIEDSEELAFVRTFHDPDPWAAGSRLLYLRLRWQTLSGRRVGTGPALTESSA